MEPEPELQTNAAAVDSELALLPIFGLPMGGFVPNIFFDGPARRHQARRPRTGAQHDPGHAAGRPTVADVRRMIDDTLYAEKNRLAGLGRGRHARLDRREGRLHLGRHVAARRARCAGEGRLDREVRRQAGRRCRRPIRATRSRFTSAGTRRMRSGRGSRRPDRFVPGAIAYHLHSFSASTVRSETQQLGRAAASRMARTRPWAWSTSLTWR